MMKDSPKTAEESIPYPEDEPVVPLWPNAATPFHIRRSRAFQLAQSGRFPCPTLRVGGRWMVRTSDLRAALGLRVHKPERFLANDEPPAA